MPRLIADIAQPLWFLDLVAELVLSLWIDWLLVPFIFSFKLVSICRYSRFN